MFTLISLKLSGGEQISVQAHLCTVSLLPFISPKFNNLGLVILHLVIGAHLNSKGKVAILTPDKCAIVECNGRFKRYDTLSYHSLSCNPLLSSLPEETHTSFTEPCVGGEKAEMQKVGGGIRDVETPQGHVSSAVINQHRDPRLRPGEQRTMQNG